MRSIEDREAERLRRAGWEQTTPPPSVSDGPIRPQTPSPSWVLDPAHPVASAVGAYLTEPELRAMDLTVQLVNVMCQEVIGKERTRSGDVNEFVHHVHIIQQAILSQAAGRAYPGRFRTLGGVVSS